MKRPTPETLFLAVTRPAMFARLPIEVSGVLFGCSVEILFITHRPLPSLTIAAIAYLVCRMATAYDHNIFRLVFLWTTTKLRGIRNAAFWGGSSASPTSLRKPRHPSEIPSCIN
jgi:type IV secretion system protein VirB3